MGRGSSPWAVTVGTAGLGVKVGGAKVAVGGTGLGVKVGGGRVWVGMTGAGVKVGTGTTAGAVAVG